MSFTHRCPNPKCRSILSIPEKMRGKLVVCGRCGQSFCAPVTIRLAAPQAEPPRRRKAG